MTAVEERDTSPASPVAPGRRPNGVHLVWALLVAASIPWRTGVYYEGGVDPVVLAKGALGATALLVALALAGHAPRRRGVPVAPILWIGLYLAVSLLGAWDHGTFAAAAVVAARVAIVTVAVGLLVSRYGPVTAAASLVHVFGVLVAVGAASGLPSAASGRLAGAVPPMKANELALLAGVCLLWCLGKLLTGRESTSDLLAGAGFLVVVVLTGSRAGLAALAVAAVLMTVRATALSRRGFALLAATPPVLAFVVLGTSLFASVFSRGGDRGVSTLSNRTIAWDSALTMDRGTWATWFGHGLPEKHVTVPGQWWTTQLLDSSWVSAYVQTGLVGLALVVLLAVSTLGRALVLPRSAGPFWFAAVAFLCLRGILESGLFDSTTAFLVFLLVAFACRGPGGAAWPARSDGGP